MSMAMGWERRLAEFHQEKSQVQGVILAERPELQLLHFGEDAAYERPQRPVRLRFRGVRVVVGGRHW